jgi:hypothetical protein
VITSTARVNAAYANRTLGGRNWPLVMRLGVSTSRLGQNRSMFTSSKSLRKPEQTSPKEVPN